MTFYQLKRRLIRMLSFDGNPPTDEEAADAINEAYRWFARKSQYLTGEATLVVPLWDPLARSVSVLLPWGETQADGSVFPEIFALDRVRYPSARSCDLAAAAWSLDGQTLTLTGVATNGTDLAALSGWVIPQEMTEDNDTPIFPKDVHAGLAWWAASEWAADYATKRDQFLRNQAWANKAGERLRMLRRQAQQNYHERAEVRVPERRIAMF